MAALANIRPVERERLRGLLLPGYLVQISGPPMIGKLTVLNQVLEDMDSESRLQSSQSPVLHAGPFIFHRFSCKYVGATQTVLMNMAMKLTNVSHNAALNPHSITTENVLESLKFVLQNTDANASWPCHHIIVFEKCESLVTHDADSWFLHFLSRLMVTLRSHLVTVVFTSYKRFEWSGWYSDVPDRMVIGPIQDYDGNLCCTLEMGQLMDNDILCLMQHFAPMVDPSPYLHIFQKFFGFPEAVRKVVQTFLLATSRQGDGAALSSETLDTLVKTDMNFLHSVFASRLDEVIDWVGLQNLFILRHIGSSLDSSATRECFRSVATGECDYDRWRVLEFQLRRYYVIRELPGIQRIVVHPLVVYFCCTQFKAMLITLRGQETNLFSNRFTHFLCATLTSLDALSSLKGMHLKMVTNLLHECPNIRHVIGMALLANEDSYGAYLKLAISGGGILGLLCPREVIGFFSCLFQRAKEYGKSLIEQAILLGLYGQALAWGTGSNWQESSDHLSEAIRILSKPGVEPSYYLLLFLKERAMIQARQGRYDESLSCFKRAKKLFGHIKTHALDERFAVTESKLRETQLITCVYETVPMIFKGNNEQAKTNLLVLAQELEQEFPNSMELATAKNQLGLSEQRGRSSPDSDERAEQLYLISLRLRSYYVKVNPIPLYAPLNNVAMLSYSNKHYEKFYSLLNEALQISLQFDWYHYYTGLSLVHLAEGSIGLGNFNSALMYLIEAERVLTKTAKDHDLRLRALLELAHVMVALKQNPSHQEISQQLACTNGLPSDGQLVSAAAHMCKPISPEDLNKTALYYLERLSALARDMKGTLSDDGHHFVLSAYEHALSFNWQNAEEVKSYKALIFEHVEKNEFVELFERPAPSRYHNMYNHKEVYFYLKQSTGNDHSLDLNTFLSKQVPACTICKKYGRQFFTKNMWFKELTAGTLRHRIHCSMYSSSLGVTSALACQPANHSPQTDFTPVPNNSLTECSNKDNFVKPFNHLNKASNWQKKSTKCSNKLLAFGSQLENTTKPKDKSVTSSRIQFAGLAINPLDDPKKPNHLLNSHFHNPEFNKNHTDAIIPTCQATPDAQIFSDAVGYSERQFQGLNPSSPFPSPRCITTQGSDVFRSNDGSSGLNLGPGLLESSLLQSNDCEKEGKTFREPVEDTEPPSTYFEQENKPAMFLRRQPEENDEGPASGLTHVDLTACVTTCEAANQNLSSNFSISRSLLNKSDTSANQDGNCDSYNFQNCCFVNGRIYEGQYVSLTEHMENDTCEANHNFDSGRRQEKASRFEDIDNFQQGIRELTLSKSYENFEASSGTSSSSGLGSMSKSMSENLSSSLKFRSSKSVRDQN